MDLVILFGPPAVGKMTVGLELQKLTGFKLLHNHASIEIGLQFFPHGTPEFDRISEGIRNLIFETVAGSSLPGLIFTFVWAVDQQADRDYIAAIQRLFEANGGTTSFVELSATQETRLARNATPLRLKHKSSKRDLEFSNANLKAMDARWTLNTSGGFMFPGRWLKIDNDNLLPAAAGRQIVDHFGFPLQDELARD
jgi:hypothetical protein